MTLIFYQLGRLTDRHISPESISWASGFSLPVYLFDAMRVTERKS